MNSICLLLGSNIENRLLNISKAIVLIEKKIGEIIERSSIYETEPWGFRSKDKFINLALTARTTLKPNEILEHILQIEKELGRKKTRKGYESRLIDIDIIFYNSEVVNTKKLIIPHPKLPERKFALIPVNEINSEYVHPVLNQPVNQILANCTDKKKVVFFDN